MKKWVSTLLSILLLLNNFVTPISAIAEGPEIFDESYGEQTPAVDILGGADSEPIPGETEETAETTPAPENADPDVPAVEFIDGVDLTEGQGGDETVTGGDEENDAATGEGDEENASNYSAFISGYAYTAGVCDVYDEYDLADDQLAAHVLGTLEAGQLVYAIDRYGDGVSDDNWMRIAFAVEKDGQIDFAQVFVPVSSLNAVAAEELDALKAELAAADNAASFDCTLLTPAAFTLKVVEKADTPETEEEPEEETTGDAPAPLPPVATVYEFACGLEAHTHTADCYNEAGELTCGLVEHVHDADCLVAAQFEQPEEQDDYHWSADSEEQPETQPEETVATTELSTRYGDSLITLTADPGVIPDGAEVVVRPVDSGYVMIRIFESVPAGMELESFSAYDIKLLVDGEEVEPSDDVHVEITNAIATVSLFSANVSEKQTVVYHVTNDGAIPVTGLRDVSSTIRFDAPHFSIYAVAVFTKKPGGTAGLEAIEKYYQTKTQNGHIKVTVDNKEVDIDLNSPAFDFHIFADEATLNEHTNGNIAANVLKGNGAGFGNNQYNASGNVQENYIGERAEGLGNIAGGGRIVIGDTVYYQIVDNGNHVTIGTASVEYRDGKPGYTKDGTWIEITDWSSYKQASDKQYTNDVYQEKSGTDPYLNIKEELAKLSKTSKLLANADTTEDVGVVQDGTDAFRHKIDTKGKGDVVIVDIDASIYNTTDIFNVWTDPGQTVVINVDVTNKKDLSQWESHLNGLGNDESSIFYDCNLIWNFYTKDDANNKVPCTGELMVGSGNGFFGTVLAPDSDLVNYGAINGTVIGKKTKQNGNESHQMFFHTGNSVKFTVNKTLIDEGANPDEVRTFYFALFSDAAGTNRLTPPKAVSVKAGQTGSVDFFDLDADGTYYVFETDSNGNRLTYSDYAITGDNGEQLRKGKQTANITNTAKPDFTPKIKKTFNPEGSKPKEGTVFTFNLVQTAGPGVPENPHKDTVKVSQGVGLFSKIEYTEAGTYVYQINEVNEGEDGVTYDTTVWTVTVVIENQGGKLVRKSITYQKNTDWIDPKVNIATFVNTLPRPTQWTPQAKKTFEAADSTKNGIERTFTFILEDDKGNLIQSKDVTITTGTKDQDIFFDTIPLTAAGTYHYRIREKTDGDEPGVTFDETVYNVDIEVTLMKDEWNSWLNAAVTYKNAAGEVINSWEALFTNTYNGKDTSFTPKANKTVVGDGAPDNVTFNFRLSAAVDNPEGATLPSNRMASVTGTGDATFGDIHFTQAGTYKFQIDELEPSDMPDEWDYDESTWTLTVEVVEEGDKLVVKSSNYTKDESTEADATAAQFTNTYTKPSEAEFEPKVKKEFDGPVPADFTETFNFTLKLKSAEPVDGVNMTGDDVKPASVTWKNGEENVSSFGPVKFTKAGTYTFEITEAGSTNPNVTNDSESTKEIKVVVEPDGAGLHATADVAEATVTFTNTYKEQKVEFVPQVKKVIEDKTGGTLPNEKREFTFQLKDGDKVLGTATVTVPAGATESNFESFVLDAAVAAELGLTVEGNKIIYTEADAGEHTYTIHEVVPESVPAGWTYAEDQTVTVEVTMSDGKLSVTPSGKSTQFTFMNVYNMTSFVPKVKKAFDGVPDGYEETFEFTLELTGANPADGASMAVGGTQTVELNWPDDKDTEVPFDAVEFTAAGTYTFTVKETAGTNENVTYDDSEETIKVVVSEDPVTGKLTTDPASGTTTVTFTNGYKDQKTSFVPKVKKVVAPAEGSTIPENLAADFTFTLSLKDGDLTGVIMPATTVTLNWPEEAEKSFDAVEFTKAGTYTFAITETDGKVDNVAYDTGAKEITVVVSEDLTTGKLTTDVDGGTATVTVTNTYYDDPTIQPGVKKTLEIVGGTTVPEDLTFTFALEKTAGSDTGVTMSAPKVITVPASEIDDDWFKQFGKIAFDEEGKYEFTIKETAKTNAHVEYDDREWKLNVEVAENDVHALVITSKTFGVGNTQPEAPDVPTAEFTNSYTEVKTDYTPKVHKIVTGPAPEKTFNFELKAINGAPMPADEAGAKASVQGNGDAFFGKIVYDKTGTYEYEVSEVKGDDAGFTYDETVYTLTVEVTDENGVLTATPTYTAGDITSKELATFTNTYKPAPADYTPEVEKVIKGENPPEDEVFIFNLIDSDAKVIDTVRLYGAGKTSFDPIHYEEAGTYNYSIVEVDNKTNNWTFDDTVYGLTVVVTDVDAQLTVSGVYMLNGAPVPDNGIATFTNTYTQSDTSLALGGIKRMAGRDFQPGDTFTFTLAAQTENAPLPAQTSVTVTPASGNEVTYSFGEITYDAVASYTYRITETASNAIENVTYDTTVWTVTVDVVRNADNTLTAVATYTSNATDGRRDGEFVNTYTIPEIEYVTLGGTKTWVDDGNSAGVRPTAIEVVLYANGVPQGNVPTWTNTDSDVWSYSFANLPATTADGTRIVYTVTETPVPLYESSQDGMNLVNRLIPREEVEYTSVSGTKHWDDSDNARDVRPASVTIELVRNGEVIDQRTVSEADGWNYSFTNLPTGDGYGTTYTYEIREQMVSGYYAVYEGFDVTNVELPTPVLFSFTPGEGQIVSRQRPNFETYTEEELEDLIDLFDYGVPLYGMLLGTGDETPLYPFVFGGVGVIALAAALLIGRKKKAKAQ